jgi:hypothetical protein
MTDVMEILAAVKRDVSHESVPPVEDVWRKLNNEAARRGSSRRLLNALRRRGSRRTAPAAAILVLALSGSAGGLALAGTFSGTAENPQAWVDGQRVQPEEVIPPEQSADLEILRRPRVATDALSALQVSELTDSPTAANGPNPDLSRSAQGLTNGSAWLIPGDGMICFEYALTGGAGGGGTCQPDALVNAGKMVIFGGYTSAHPVESVAGVVPDGVTSVTITTTTGDSTEVPVHENVYVATLPGMFASMTFSGPNGTVTVNS